MADRRGVIQAGRLDREIVIQHRTQTQDPVYGTPTEGEWEDWATVWAEVQDMLPSRGENIADGIDVARRPCRIRIRYRDDITSGMQVKIEQRTLRIITMPAELGRREGLEFVAEEVTTSVQQP